ncbi:MAG: putative ABC transporter permease [Candidatus Nanoarchaeia archaeon]|nr:putative ABC transporter permease [Candidatus Nanoarchaeia archaeon]MDD5239762.1 putative ABC transporter permease [Candidatus Nanoarchaeia archaeon]
MVLSWIDLLFLFAAGSLMGWMAEVLFNRRLKKLNPGFLNGPYLPVYGFGLILVYLISLVPMNLILRIIVFAVVTTGLELVSGLIFINLYKIRIWDYSNNFMNFRGIICPLCTFYFTVLSLIFYFFMFPYVNIALSFTEGNTFAYFILGAFYTIFSIDTINSLRIASRVKKAVTGVNKEVTINYSLFKDSVVDYLKRTGEASFVLRFIFTLNNIVSNEMQGQINRFLKKKE